MHRHRHIQSHTVAQTHTHTNIHRKTDRHTHACRSEADLLSDREASIPTRTWSFSWLRWRYINLCEKKDDTYRRRSSNAEALYSIRSIGHVQLRHLSLPSSPLTRGRRFVMGASANEGCSSVLMPLCSPAPKRHEILLLIIIQMGFVWCLNTAVIREKVLKSAAQ